MQCLDNCLLVGQPCDSIRSVKTGDGNPECDDERDEHLSMLVAVIMNYKGIEKDQQCACECEISLLSTILLHREVFLQEIIWHFTAKPNEVKSFLANELHFFQNCYLSIQTR